MLLHSKASRQFGSPVAVGCEAGGWGDVAGGLCVMVIGLRMLQGTGTVPSWRLHRSQHGPRADTGCSWLVWQRAQQVHLSCCASPAVVQATEQGFIFHLLWSHSQVPFRLSWGKNFFCPPANPASGMVHDIDCLVLQVF